MSGKVSGWVWDLDLPQNEKYVLLAYADHADHEGRNVFPSVGLVARKTGYSHRSIQRIVKDLKEKGYLVPDGTGVHGTNKYLIPLPVGGDTMTPPPIERGDTIAQGGDKLVAQKGDTSSTPEPSLTVTKEETSVKPAPRKRDARLDHPAITTYKEVARYHVPIIWRDNVIDAVGDRQGDVSAWGALIKSWIGRGWKPNNVEGMLDAYKNGGISRADKPAAGGYDAMLEEVMRG